MATRPKSAQPPQRLLDMRHVYQTPEPAESSPEAHAETHGQKILRQLLKDSTQKFMQMWRDEEDAYMSGRRKKKKVVKDIGSERCRQIIHDLLKEFNDRENGAEVSK